MTLILASQSASRRAMLTAAGVLHVAILPEMDEEAAKADLLAAGADSVALAEGLALAKAQSIAKGLVLGCDQTLECHDGQRLDKAPSLGALADQLRHMSGQTHRLISAAAIVEDGQPVWTATDQVQMHMRPLSDAFIADYLQQEGESLLACVGGYRIEGKGAQLFSGVEGSQFVVQGLPLLPLLNFLRHKGLLIS